MDATTLPLKIGPCGNGLGGAAALTLSEIITGPGRVVCSNGAETYAVLAGTPGAS